MIDENKEQLRNLFRTYNVVDVQPAVGDKLPDDITTLQVCNAVWEPYRHFGIFVTRPLFLFTFAAGDHHPSRVAVLGRNSVCDNELALP